MFVASGGRARFVPLKTGIWTQDYVEASGLRGDEKVILLNDKLKSGLTDGTKVKPGPVSGVKAK